jgi:hypothetical protein
MSTAGYVFGKSQRSGAPTKPVNFLQTHKYEARYNIFWRFIARLLDAEKGDEAVRVFKIIKEPLFDILGPTHQ